MLTHTTTYQQLARDLTLDGWAPGAPSANAEEIARDTCAESSCEQCGRIGLAYHPWMHADERRYKVFAVCPSCSAVTEF